MKFIVTSIIGLLFVISIQAGESFIKGEIQLKYSEKHFGGEKFEKEFGGVVKAKTDWRVGDFFGEETVFAGVTLENTGGKPMFYQYYVAFFDKDRKLIGATGQGGAGEQGLAPEKRVQLGSCLIHLPKDKYKEIKFYEAVIYETEVTLRKK